MRFTAQEVSVEKEIFNECNEYKNDYPCYDEACARYRRYYWGPKEGWINKDGVDIEKFLTKDQRRIFDDVTRTSGGVIEALVELMDGIVCTRDLNSCGLPPKLVKALVLAGVPELDAESIAARALSWRLCQSPWGF
jgi:hypothetical protein